MTANDQTPWEPEGPVGGFEINSVEPKCIKHDRRRQEWLMLNYDRDLPLVKRGEFRVVSRADILNLGKIKMKSTDESGRMKVELRGRFADTVEVSKRWASLLFEDGGIRLERNSPALEVRAILAKHRVWNRHGKSIKLYREGNLYNAYVRAGDVTPELAPVEPAKGSWTRMDVDEGDNGEQDEADQPEELRRVLAARAVFALWCEVGVQAKG